MREGTRKRGDYELFPFLVFRFEGSVGGKEGKGLKNKWTASKN